MAKLLFVKVFILLSLSILITTNHALEPKYCRDPVAGTSRLMTGIDLVEMDIHPLEHGGIGGRRRPIIKKTCNRQSRTIRLHGHSFQIPDQVSDVLSSPGGSKSAYVKVFKSYKEVKESMGVTVGVSGQIFGLGFSLSTSYKHAQDSISNSNKEILDVKAEHYSHTIYLRKIGSDNFLRTSFQLDLDNLKGKTYVTHRDLFKQFIKDYGTHFFEWGLFGGIIRKYMETSKEYTKTKSVKELRVQAMASYNGLVNSIKGTVKVDVSKTKVDSKFSAVTHEYIRYYGGTANLLNSKGLQSWQKTVDINPALLKTGIAPIYELITKNSVRHQVKVAIDQHILRNYLHELARKLKTAAGKYPDIIVTKLWKRLNNFQKAGMLDVVQVASLNKDIVFHTEVPSWFSDHTRYCFKYRSGQPWFPMCNDYKPALPSLFCALPDSYTERYHDNTGSFYQRNEGCYMHFGIRSPMAPDWFKNVFACLIYSEDVNGNGPVGHNCAIVGKFTGGFFDKTKKKSDKNELKWMISNPDGSPLWFKKSRLCMEWTSTRGQCWGDEKQLCAHPGQQTRPFTDTTHRRDKGCYLRWGWFTK